MTTGTTTRNEPAPELARHRFRTALISTAGHCAVACGFCFRADRAHGYLAIPTYATALSRLKEIGVEGVCLTGGEPTHHPDLRQLIRLSHQFGMPVSVVTSARTPAEVRRLREVSHLLANVTVSADSAEAMRLGRTTRSVLSGVSALRDLATLEKVLHLTYWKVTDDECRDAHRLVSDAGVVIQLSPVTLDEGARRRNGLTLHAYLQQQRNDAKVLARHFRLTPRFQVHLDALRAMQLGRQEAARECCSTSLYVSADGKLRRCPYGSSGVPVQAPRSEIDAYLTAGPKEWTTPDCAAICRADP